MLFEVTLKVFNVLSLFASFSWFHALAILAWNLSSELMPLQKLRIFCLNSGLCLESFENVFKRKCRFLPSMVESYFLNLRTKINYKETVQCVEMSGFLKEVTFAHTKESSFVSKKFYIMRCFYSKKMKVWNLRVCSASWNANVLPETMTMSFEI